MEFSICWLTPPLPTYGKSIVIFYCLKMISDTSIGRRKHKNRGRVVSGYGRRHKDTALTSQLVVLEDQDNVYPSLNPQTRRSNRMVHDLSTAVSRNVSNARKH